MPTPDYTPGLLSEVQLTCPHGHWRVSVRYGERLYDLGTYRLYGDAHHACTPSALGKALSSSDKRAARQVADAQG